MARKLRVDVSVTIQYQYGKEAELDEIVQAFLDKLYVLHFGVGVDEGEEDDEPDHAAVYEVIDYDDSPLVLNLDPEPHEGETQ